MDKIIINAEKGNISLNLKELISYKDLFFTLAYRDLRVRYAQTFLGLLWAVIQPLTTLVIFTVVFGRAMNVNTGGIPYPLFALAGMTAWTYFSFVMSQAGNSIIEAEGMVKKIYFPRLIIPISKAVVGLVDFIVSLAFSFVLMVYYRYPPSFEIIYLPFFLLLTIISSLAVGIWLSALTIRFRDFKHIVPFMVQIGLYVTPIAYPASLIPLKYQPYFFLNPMAGIVEGFRWCLLGAAPPSPYSYISYAIILILFISGLYYFRKVERIIADIV
jgi:lipopolysaccharide transport system permease protein